MKKTILLIGLLLIPLVYGITLYDGMIITQEQLDGINLSQINWQILNITKTSSPYFEFPYVSINYTSFNIKENPENTYLVYTDYRKVKIHYSFVIGCLLRHPNDPIYCRNLYRLNVRNQALYTVTEVRNFVEDHQTPQNISEIIMDWDEDW